MNTKTSGTWKPRRKGQPKYTLNTVFDYTPSVLARWDTWVKELQTTVNFSGLDKAILKLFEIYFRIEQTSKCVPVVGSQGSQDIQIWNEGRPERALWGWMEIGDMVWTHDFYNEYEHVYMHTYVFMYLYLYVHIHACVYSLALSTEKAKNQCRPSSNDHTWHPYLDSSPLNRTRAHWRNGW